ncbi:hypothetical protein EQV77_06550 [Halobacillus fulvus]|nr:hypothetical protein EQV77_06550 [Halobacillus fulvus]
MKHIYAFENKEEYEQHAGVIDKFREQLEDYQKHLEEKFELHDLPRGIVWTSTDLATNTFSELPIPAFTNKDMIYISPDLLSWRKLFLDQLENERNTYIEKYYRSLSEKHLFTIVGHELTHHSDLFVDEFDDIREDSIWFEEGMCDYLSRKYILNDAEFKEIVKVETELIEMFKGKYGRHGLDEFGHASYQGSLTSIMFDYWRSFLAIRFLVEERFEDNIQTLFEEYHEWNRTGRKVALTDYLEVPFLYQ